MIIEHISELNNFYFFSLIVWILLSIITFFVLLILSPPTYGRHIKSTAASISNRWGWFLMELPAIVLLPIFYFWNSPEINVVTLCFISLYMLHYFNRIFIFPFRIKTRGKRIPLLIVFYAVVFNLCNTYFIGYFFGNMGKLYNDSWFFSPYFIIGILIFSLGAYLNNISDHILIRLRNSKNKEYRIPRRGLFKYVSCPNYTGEIIEWVGFAILTFSIPTAAFALWTMANLVPRAIDHHDWYKNKFKDYPKSRRALIPFIL